MKLPKALLPHVAGGRRALTRGRFGAVYPGFDEELLLHKLGMTPDREKIRYYLLLDELF